jgi:AAA ATPase domain
LGFGGDLDQNANVGADLPLVARGAELAILTGAIEAAKSGRGDAVLLIGEAGVGKTRLLIETQREAEGRGVLVLKGRAVESGGAYRPLVEAFARASAAFADQPDLEAYGPSWRGFCLAGSVITMCWRRWPIPPPSSPRL